MEISTFSVVPHSHEGCLENFSGREKRRKTRNFFDIQLSFFFVKTFHAKYQNIFAAFCDVFCRREKKFEALSIDIRVHF